MKRVVRLAKGASFVDMDTLVGSVQVKLPTVRCSSCGGREFTVPIQTVRYSPHTLPYRVAPVCEAAQLSLFSADDYTRVGVYDTRS
jgi:hypothetical protein